MRKKTYAETIMSFIKNNLKAPEIFFFPFYSLIFQQMKL